MTTNRILVIGGVATGAKAAARARRRDPNAEITIVERGRFLSYAGCGMPYYIQGEVHDFHELMSTPAGVIRDAAFFQNVKDIRVLNQTLAEKIDRAGKKVTVVNTVTGARQDLPYDKLVIATGGVPVEPRIEDTNLNRVFRLNLPDDALAMREAVEHAGIKRAVLIGGGLIGLETAEALVTRGIHVTVVEMLDQLLPAMLDWEVAAFLEKYLRSKGLGIRLNEKVTRIEGDGNGNVARVVTSAGTLDADMVLIAIGVRPNVQLAKDAGLKLGQTGALAVNDQLQTSDPDIYAGGDCVECTHLITGQKVFVPLGSTANKHGHVIGDNITGGTSKFPGIIGTTVFKVLDYNLARTGLTEKQARQLGHNVITALVPGPDRAHYYPTAKTLLVKLVADAGNGQLLGAQVLGPGDAVKRIDVLATALTFGATMDLLAGIDLGYAPPYATAVDLIAHAANVLRNKRDGLAPALTPQQVKAKLDADEPVVLLDVRTPAERDQMQLRDPRVVWIPLGQLRKRVGELPRDKEIICFCKVSQRGYEAQRILDGLGVPNVKFLDGGLIAWPYPLEPERK
ncbi:MAG: Coenzyme A disulfide reductase [Verrucomicrobiae bacterium]|nr:Coenzyme A disulfide reductase [Verrucomicrobiae bacterium]